MTEYIELHCHSNYSLLDGASSVTRLLAQAHQLRMTTLALTDHNNVYQAVNFQKQAHALGIKPIFGSELTLETGHHLTLLVKNIVGWRNLCYLITQGQHHADKGESLVPRSSFTGHTEGLIALSGCRQSEIASCVLNRDFDRLPDLIDLYIELFGRDNFYIELQNHHRPDDRQLIKTLVQVANQYLLSYVATNNVHYALPDDYRLQDVLVCIRHNTTLDQASQFLRPNSEFYIKSGLEMLNLFIDYPQAISNTVEIANRCNFSLDSQLQSLPPYPTPDNMSASEYVRQLCLLSDRCHSSLIKRLVHELAIIDEAGLSNYFLIVWDIVRYAREQGIGCQGRGSAANSIVAYLLYVTPINPLEHDLVFERFLSRERDLTPDIDIDFDANRRDEVIQYVYNRYGLDHAAMACTFVTYRTKSAVRDVAKVFGMASAEKTLLSDMWERQQDDVLLFQESPLLVQMLDLCQQLQGYPRHLGIHNGGMVITTSLLCDRVPTEPARKIDYSVVQWDKDSLEDAGMVKIDILGLKMISVISEAVALTGVDIDALTFNDPQVFSMISDADTIGVFQVESRAQMQMLPRFRPKTFADLIIAISLIRPGPIQGQMVHPYIKRRQGKEPIDYLHESLKPALKETLGVILYQEQVLKIAHDFVGFTHGQGELLRRALGSKNGVELISQLEDTFISEAMQKSIDRDTAQLVFDKLRGFGSYSFAKSHAGSFAVLVYQSAWLRKYHPLAFYVSLLNNFPMGFWSPSVIVNDAQRHGITILSVDLNLSQAKCTIEDDKLRLGFNYVNGVGEIATKRILDARQGKYFNSLEDFCQRTRLPDRLVENLIKAGALDFTGWARRNLFWELGKFYYEVNPLGLESDDGDIELPEADEADLQEMELQSMGLSPRRQVMSLYRDQLRNEKILNSEQIKNCSVDTTIFTAGLQIVRQQPRSANGMVFIALEDEWGMIGIVLRSNIFQKYKRVIRKHHIVVVKGIVQKQDSVFSILAEHIQPL